MLFFKTSIFVFLTAILVGALSIPEDAERDLVERNTCKGPDGYSLTCSGNYVCVGGRGCCLRSNLRGPCYFKRDGGYVDERDIADSLLARTMYEAKEFAEREAKVVEERDVETVEERDVSIEKRACASGKKLCNGNCIPNAYTCCYGDGCPLYISGWTCSNSVCGCAYKGSCSL